MLAVALVLVLALVLELVISSGASVVFCCARQWWLGFRSSCCLFLFVFWSCLQVVLVVADGDAADVLVLAFVCCCYTCVIIVCFTCVVAVAVTVFAVAVDIDSC